MLQTTGAGAALASMGALAGCSGGGGSGGESGGSGGDSGGSSSGSDSSSSGGSTSGSSSGSQTLNIWLSYYTEGENKRKYTDEVIAAFESESGHTVNITGVPYTDIVTKFRSARAAGDVPHAVEVMTRPSVLAGGAGLVINDLFESSSLADKASDAIMDGHRVWGAQSTGNEGDLVTIPLGMRPFFPAWRTDWLESAGIDPAEVNYEAGSLNWYDDIPAIYDKLIQSDMGQQQGNYPDATGMKQSDEEYMSIYIPQHGGSKSGVVSVDGKTATINTPEALKAIKMQFDYVENGYFHENSINMGDEEATTNHWAGKQAVNHLQDSTDLWGDYREEQPDAMENGAYTWGEPMNAGTKSTLSWLPCLGFVNGGFAGQAEKDALMELLEFWVGDSDRAVENAKQLGFVPISPSAIESEDFFAETQVHEDFWRGACLGTLKNHVPASIPAVQGANTITYEIPRKMHQRILQGESIQSAADNAANEIQSILDENQ